MKIVRCIHLRRKTRSSTYHMSTEVTPPRKNVNERRSLIGVMTMAGHRIMTNGLVKKLYWLYTSPKLKSYIAEPSDSFSYYTGWPRENGMAYFPQYVDAITDISVWGNFSWEKLYQDQLFWFSNFISRAHFVRQCRGPKFSICSLNEGWMNAISACHSCEQ